MADSPERPARGLPPEEALERWSDPDEYAAMREYWDARVDVSVAPGVKPPPKVLRYQEFVRRREPLEAALQEKLGSGALMVTAMYEHADPGAPRFLVDPEMFRTAFLDFEWDRIHGGADMRVDLVHPEIFEPPGVPRNVREIPAWYRETYEPEEENAAPLSPPPSASAAAGPAFWHSDGYRHVRIGGIEHSLSLIQAQVVARLHRAYIDGKPWVRGEDLLRHAGSSSATLMQVFRRYDKTLLRTLILSDGRGFYRLNLADETIPGA